MATSGAGKGGDAADSSTSLTELRTGLPYMAGALLFRPEALVLEEEDFVVLSRRFWWPELVALPEETRSDFASPEVTKVGTGVATGMSDTTVIVYRYGSEGVLGRWQSGNRIFRHVEAQLGRFQRQNRVHWS